MVDTTRYAGVGGRLGRAAVRLGRAAVRLGRAAVRLGRATARLGRGGTRLGRDSASSCGVTAPLGRIALIVALAACSDAPRAAVDGAGDGAYGTLGGGPPGGTLIVLADREPDQLNPLTFSSSPAHQAVHLLFRPLARRDSTLSGYAPDLARAWHFEADGTLVIELRDDVRWHDGRRVTADDVVFTIERQRDPQTGSPRQADVTAVEAVVARDSFTVAVRLSRTGLYTVNALLEVVTVPQHLLGDVPAADLRLAPFGRRPVGNGFYRFGSWVPGQSLTLEVDPAKPDGRAAIERIVMRFIPDVTAGITELLVDRGDLLARLPPDQQARIAAAAHLDVHTAPRVRPAWIAWNTRRPPLDDVRVRRALSAAIDRPALARWLFGDDAEPAFSPIPTSLREHTPGVRPIPYDPAAARRLLDEAGWHSGTGAAGGEPAGGAGAGSAGAGGARAQGSDRAPGSVPAQGSAGGVRRNAAGQPLRVEVDYVSTDATRRDVLVALQSMLRDIGVELVPRAYESTAWVQRLRDGTFTGSFWGWGWGPGVVGPNAEMVFHSRSIPPRGANFAAASNARIDALIDAALVAPDTAAARPIWTELEQLMIDDAVYAPIYMDPELYAVHGRFGNVRFRGVEWMEDVPYWYVEAGRRLGRDR